MQKYDEHNQEKAIDERFKNERLNKNLTQTEFGERLFGENVADPKSRISKIERGKELPTVATLIYLNDVFNISPEYILFGEIDPNVKRFCDALNNPKIGHEFANRCKELAVRICPYFTSNEQEEDFYGDEHYLGYVDSDDPDNPSVCSLRIKKLLKLNRLKQSEVAKTLRVSKSTVSEWLKKPELPSLELLFSLHKYFGLSVDYILLGTIIPFHNRIFMYFRESNYEIQCKLLEGCIKILENF